MLFQAVVVDKAAARPPSALWLSARRTSTIVTAAVKAEQVGAAAAELCHVPRGHLTNLVPLYLNGPPEHSAPS